MAEELKYKRIKNLIIENINSGTYNESNYLPTERELCELYNVSRVTIRNALDALEQEGAIIRIKGKGTFIKKKPQINQPLTNLTGFTEDMKARGMVPASQILVKEMTSADDDIAENLMISKGDPVIRLSRLRLADDEPMGIETIYMDGNAYSEVLDDFEEGSFYEFIQQRYGIVPQRAVQSIEVCKLLKWEAKLLDTEEIPYALLMHRQSFDGDGKPIEFVVSKYRSDRYKFQIELLNV